jgi:hypothetical protein
MKITIRQLRKLINEEISNVSSKPDPATLALLNKIDHGPLSLQRRAREMMADPSVAQDIADKHDEALALGPSIYEYIKANDDYGAARGINNKLLDAAIDDAMDNSTKKLKGDPDAYEYLMRGFEMARSKRANAVITGAELMSAIKPMQEREVIRVKAQHAYSRQRGDELARHLDDRRTRSH